MKECPICHKLWRRLTLHLWFVHQEIVVMWIGPKP